MIVTDYQFISVVLSLKDNSAARIWGTSYVSGAEINIMENGKFLLKTIKNKK